jgi:hypothetical protein
MVNSAAIAMRGIELCIFKKYPVHVSLSFANITNGKG